MRNNHESSKTAIRGEVVTLCIRATGMVSARRRSPSKVRTSVRAAAAANSFYEVENEEGAIIGKSTVVRNEFDPNWPPIQLDYQALVCGNPDRAMALIFYDYHEKTRKSRVLACIHTSITELQQAAKAHKANATRESYNLKKIAPSSCEDEEEDDVVFKVYICDVIESIEILPPTITFLRSKIIRSSTPCSNTIKNDTITSSNITTTTTTTTNNNNEAGNMLIPILEHQKEKGEEVYYDDNKLTIDDDEVYYKDDNFRKSETIVPYR